jgi:hypothetical protein
VWFVRVFAASLLMFLATKLVADLLTAPPTTNARQGHHAMVRGEMRTWYWLGIAALVVALSLTLIAWNRGFPLLGAVGGLFALPALWSLEHSWVQAGQAPSNS